MADITYIPIRQLHPHPDNPRKELGDLSELAASIKENGVYQNLTVIPGHYLSSREYISKCVDEGGDAAAAAAAWAPKVMWVGDDYTIMPWAIPRRCRLSTTPVWGCCGKIAAMCRTRTPCLAAGRNTLRNCRMVCWC